MRRMIPFLAAIAALVIVVQPVAAAAETFRYSVSGQGAYAFGGTSTESSWEGAWVEIGQRAVRASDGSTSYDFVYFEHYREICGRHSCSGQWTSGWAEDVPFTIDSKLRNASVSAEIPAVQCTWDGRSESCVDVLATVDVTWTGAGPLVRFHGTSNGGAAGDYQYTSSGNGSERQATVSGTVDGFDLGATTDQYGVIYSQKYGERYVSHSTGGE